MGTRGAVEGTRRRDVASHPWFILIAAVSLLQGPRWSGPTAEREGRATAAGGKRGGESVEGECDRALLLCPGDLWS